MAPSRQLTAEALIAAPRRSAAIPNRDGTLALYTVSTHCFEEHKTRKELRVMNLVSGQSEQLSDDQDVYDGVWIPGTDADVLYLKSTSEGLTEVYVASGADTAIEHYLAATISAPVEKLKLRRLRGGSVAFVVAGLASEDGSLYNEKKDVKWSSGQVFDTVHVQIWNTLYKDFKYALWYGMLTVTDRRWSLSGELQNVVNGVQLEAPFGMYNTWKALDNFDICDAGIAFVARDLTRTWHEAESVSFPYFLPIDSFAAPPTQKPYRIPLPAGSGLGAGFNVRLSQDGSTFGFLHDSNDDPCNVQLFIASINTDGTFEEFRQVHDVQHEGFDPPSRFEFAGSADSIIIERQQHGRIALAQVHLGRGEKPRVFLISGAISDFHPLKEGGHDLLLVSSSSFVESSLWRTVSVAGENTFSTLSSLTENGVNWGLSPDMVTEFWYEGTHGVQIHSWMLLPPGFDKTSPCPWILLPHGGPESAWKDSWSTRWNAAYLAAQGYVVVCPNIAGSKGYGIEFTRRVQNEWAGTAFTDLLLLINHLEKLPWLDQGKAVIAGASYGAYLISWMMGHDVIQKFCCAVWHAGRFDLPTSLLQADLVKWDSAFGGAPFFWERERDIEKFNPATPERLRNWAKAPPTLVCHGQKDYRCPWGDGVATFKTLQRLGVRSRLLTFPDEGHWILGRENARLWLQNITDWIKMCVDGEITSRGTAWPGVRIDTSTS
ncbi:hypothetical protein HIM_10224 [Hirsutella minnesotensis 3608]|uniref:Dipeptidyl-peptidase V n=1 Tax=Hirsutella minnesotensis 3608 TaxID=1043627 RepID=A0A0F7ZKB2_9HYPO|nr:hypothetical protein HIM_10224 [Hirsutella minnesotensis 3608]